MIQYCIPKRGIKLMGFFRVKFWLKKSCLNKGLYWKNALNGNC